MKTIILGFDSFDPAVFEDMMGKNKLPHLSKFVKAGGYSRFEVCAPPQTEVSWTSIATGTDPGGHGIFDFVHRDPVTYAPYVSILPTKKTPLGEQFIPPYVAKTLFEEAAAMGYPTTALWWPAMFPARPELPISTLPGLGTPDIRGQLGVGTLFTTANETKAKTAVVRLESTSKGRYTALLSGPPVKGKSGLQPATLPLTLETIDTTTAKLTIGDKQLQLQVGEWSDILEIKFKVGTFFSIYAITRAILTSLNGIVRLYTLPLQIHPLHALSHYASSKSFAKNLWEKVGSYLTLGWPQDTTGLEDDCISDPAHCHYLPSPRYTAPGCSAQGFAKGGGNNVYFPDNVAVFVRSPACSSDEAGCMRIIHEYHCVIFLAQLNHLVKLRKVAIHGEYALGYYQLDSLVGMHLEFLLQVFHV